VYGWLSSQVGAEAIAEFWAAMQGAQSSVGTKNYFLTCEQVCQVVELNLVCVD
jgi:hypothetical protein